MYKRILCCVLSFLMLISLTPLSALAEGELTDPAVDAASDTFVSCADGDDSEGGASEMPPEDNVLPEEDGLTQDEAQPEEEAPSEDGAPPEEDPSQDEALPEEETPPEGDVLPEEEPPSEDGAQPEKPDENTLAEESVNGLPVEDSGTPEGGEGENEEPVEDISAEPSQEFLTLQALITDLPAAEEIANMDEDALSELSKLISRILDLYDALSEEEQALVDLSAVYALYDAMDAQTFSNTELGYTVSYSPEPSSYRYDLVTRADIPVFNDGNVTFTLNGTGGSNSYEYYFGGVLLFIDGALKYDAEHKNAAYSASNSITYDFASSGTYRFYCGVRDTTTNNFKNIKLDFSIDDPSLLTVEQKADAIVQECNNRNFTTEYEKALFYHDWIVDHATYDYSYNYAGAGGVLCRGTGTCQSYHDALELLLKRSGIASEPVKSTDHIWNRVCLDGEWTLIDSTWDDSYKTDAISQHLYFGLTDELMQQVHSEHKTNPDHLCDSLERNYLIRSGKITSLSTPIKEEIKKLAPGNHTIPASTGDQIGRERYYILCPIVAYYLTNKDSELESPGVEVTYNSDAEAYSVRVYCEAHQFETVPGTPATCTQTGLTEGKKCSICGFVEVPQKTISMLPHTEATIPGTPATCTQTGLTEGKKCSVCQTVTVAQQVIPVISHNKDVIITGIPATCTRTGLTEGKKCSVCQTVTVAQQTIPLRAHTPVTDPAVQPSGFNPGLTEGSHCSVCGKTLVAQQQYYSKTALILPSDGLSGKAVWVDGVQLPQSAVTEKDGKVCIELSRTDASSLVTYTYNQSSSDPHQVYPIGMKVWMLEYNGGYTAKHIGQFDDLLKYAGSSIRITGVKGIRMITGIRQDVKNALTGGGIGGYTLREYGTVLAWASEVSASSLVLGAPGAKSNFAYKRGVADPVFASGGGVTQYTNVLVGFNNDQCKADIVMRPYIVLRAPSGRDVTVYGGVVQRSIGYIAYQNRAVFPAGSNAYNYVWDIIHHVYGNKFG